MSEYLFEIYGEEIPSRFQKQAVALLQEGFHNELLASRLTYTRMEGFVTHRRLGICIEGLPEKQQDYVQDKRGPRVDADPKAVQAFANSMGLDIDRLVRRNTEKGEFYFAVQEFKGELLSHLMGAIVQRVIDQLTWPKSMRWNATEKSWVRPIHHGISVLNGEPLPLRLDFGGGVMIPFGNSTKGHMFMAPEPFAVTSFLDYCERLKHRFVFVQQAKRRDYIANQIQALATTQKLHVIMDEDLLDEVCGMVEFPYPILGKIESDFMSLPRELLITVMRHHQRYFALQDAKGQLAPFFIVVANIVPEDGGNKIIEGNQRVLRARFSDAQFFFKHDKMQPLESYNAKLEKMTFHKDLGSVAKRVRRLVQIVSEYALMTGIDLAKAQRAAFLCKADLGTSMVYEFPELQGIMGNYYAASEGEDVARAIQEHYLPAGAESALPQSPLGRLLALADKVDALIGFFGIGLRPTGSKDPYALRRGAIGVIRILETDGLDLCLDKVFKAAFSHFQDVTLAADTVSHVLDFIRERLDFYWNDQGIRRDIFQAIAAHINTEPLGALRQRAVTLQIFCSSPEGMNLLQAFLRSFSIVEQQKASLPDGALDHIQEALLTFPAEKLLVAATRDAEADTAGKTLEQKLQRLALLRQPIDGFLNTVMVNDPNESVRYNRLAILHKVVKIMMQIADFHLIQA